MEINRSLASQLIKEQFPQWANLAIKSVEISGIDNRTFRLGENMLIRLPSAECYSLKVEKEQEWLPLLAPHLSISILFPSP